MKVIHILFENNWDLQAKIWCQLSSLKQISEWHHKATSVTSKLKSLTLLLKSTSQCPDMTRIAIYIHGCPKKDDQNHVRNGWKSPSRNHKEPFPETFCGLAMQFLWWQSFASQQLTVLWPSATFVSIMALCGRICKGNWKRCFWSSEATNESRTSGSNPTEPASYRHLFRHRVSQREVTSCPTSMAFTNGTTWHLSHPKLSHLPILKMPTFFQTKKTPRVWRCVGPRPWHQVSHRSAIAAKRTKKLAVKWHWWRIHSIHALDEIP